MNTFNKGMKDCGERCVLLVFFFFGFFWVFLGGVDEGGHLISNRPVFSIDE